MSVHLKHSSFGNWKEVLELSNGTVSLSVLVEAGPRIIFYGFEGGQNFFKNLPASGDSSEWQNYGGHRLWHAPEKMPRSYYPDNAPVDYEWNGGILTLKVPAEKSNQIRKEIKIELAESGTRVQITHKIYNIGAWEIELSAWSLSVMEGGGTAIVPHEDYIPHGSEEGESFLPARPLVLWHFTTMNDPRFCWGEKYIRIREDASINSKQKIGLLNSKGWMAYKLGSEIFIKRHHHKAGALYPDFGSNEEIFTMPGLLELETLSPLTRLEPGQHLEHRENWELHNGDIPDDENGMEAFFRGLESNK